MRLFVLLLNHSRATLALSVAAGAASGLSAAGLIVLINGSLGRVHDASWVLAGGFCGLCLIRLLTGFTAQTLLFRLSQDAILDMRMRLSRRIFAARLRQIEEIGGHRLLAALTDDVTVISNAFVSIPILIVSLAMLAGCVIYLAWLSPTTFVTAIACMTVWAMISRTLAGKAVGYLKAAREETDALFGHFRALTLGAKELKLSHERRQAFETAQLEPTAGALRKHNITGEAVYAAAANWGRLSVFIFIGVLLFVLPRITDLGVETLTGATLTALFMGAPLDVIFNQIPAIGRANVALKKIDALGLSLSPYPGETISPPTRAARWRNLKLDGVTHTYHREFEDQCFTLGPLDLEILPGEVIFLVGGNGSGKTTLGKLITGLYIPETGAIRFDGETITDTNRAIYRQHFSAVFSDFYLFESLLGLDLAGLDAMAQIYLDRLQLSHKVSVTNGVLSTVALSQGQRKRLALLTALLEDRPICLFDEWAADQDPIFKNIFYLSLLPELKALGKTIIVITHDDQYYRTADRILKLEHGKIIEACAN